MDKFASYPQEMAPVYFTHDSQWPWLRYPATLTRSSFANHISTKAFYVTLAAAHMRLNRSNVTVRESCRCQVRWVTDLTLSYWVCRPFAGQYASVASTHGNCLTRPLQEKDPYTSSTECDTHSYCPTSWPSSPQRCL